MTEHEHINEGIKRVYRGSIVEAEYLKEIFEENGIETILRDKLQESVLLNRASISSESSAVIFVADDDYEKAVKLLGEYKESQKNKGT